MANKKNIGIGAAAIASGVGATAIALKVSGK